MDIDHLKSWLGTGSINIFGLPMSGKDTVGQRLAQALGAKFLSSGAIIREMEAITNATETASGNLIPSNLFYDWVLPYFNRPELKSFPLVLSSIGRWIGEEEKVLASTESAGHPIKAAIFLDISKDEAIKRWHTVQAQGTREVQSSQPQNAESRPDDYDLSVFEKRIAEFEEKTLPVLDSYHEKGLLITVAATGPRDTVFAAALSALAQKAL